MLGAFLYTALLWLLAVVYFKVITRLLIYLAVAYDKLPKFKKSPKGRDHEKENRFGDRW